MSDHDGDLDTSSPAWSIGLFDSHCHPTDTMSLVPSIANMKAKALVIMATRRQDQDLVSQVASQHGVDETLGPEAIKDNEDWRGVVPSYGWHPWFSHQIYDDSDHDAATGSSSQPPPIPPQHDTSNGTDNEKTTTELTNEQKAAHYTSVLTPAPDSHDFLLALPKPLPLSVLLADTRQRLTEHPLALIGEIGLDRAFRIPEAWLPEHTAARDEGLTPGGREGRRLSPYRVGLEHQKKILRAQLRLAGEMGRAVSVHGVQAHGVLFETIRGCWKGHEKEVVGKKERKKRAAVETAGSAEGREKEDGDERRPLSYPPRICLHSYSGPPDQVKQYLAPSVPAEMFFSFSLAINFSGGQAGKTEEVLKLVPDEMLLIESDLHTAGDRMDEGLKGMAERVCRLKGWELEEGVKRLRANWMRFVFGREG